MIRSLSPIDISNLPELLRLSEEVKATKTPRILKRDSETMAVLMPVGTAVPPKKKLVKMKADYAAFRSAAGGWKDVDTDRLLNDIYADRRRNNARPSVKV